MKDYLFYLAFILICVLFGILFVLSIADVKMAKIGALLLSACIILALAFFSISQEKEN